MLCFPKNYFFKQVVREWFILKKKIVYAGCHRKDSKWVVRERLHYFSRWWFLKSLVVKINRSRTTPLRNDSFIRHQMNHSTKRFALEGDAVSVKTICSQIIGFFEELSSLVSHWIDSEQFRIDFLICFWFYGENMEKYGTLFLIKLFLVCNNVEK